MYRTGHYGMSLLLYAPVGLVTVLAGFETLAVLGGVVTVALAMAPDYDQRVPGLSHRGPTHTVLFALVVGMGLAALSGAAARRTNAVETVGLTVFGFVVGTLAIVAHLAADVLTPAGIRPFWPLSNRRYSLGVARAANPVANYLLFGLGVVVTAVSLGVAMRLG